MKIQQPVLGTCALDKYKPE